MKSQASLYRWAVSSPPVRAVLWLLTAGLAGIACVPVGVHAQAHSGIAPNPAQPPPVSGEGGIRLDASSSLDDYLAHAALHNAGMKAAFHRWQAALAKVPQAEALPDPRISYGYFIRSVETRVGPQEHRVGVAQMFPWLGKRKLRGQIAIHEARMRYEEYSAERLKLFRRVKDAWYELYYLQRATAITGDNIQLLKDLESVAQTKIATGGDLAPVAQAQLELGKLEDQLQSLRDLRTPIAARLNAALNRSSDAPVHIPAKAAPIETSLDEARLEALLEEHNPELRALRNGLERDEAAVKLAKRNWFPDPMLSLDWIQTDDALNRLTPDNGKDPVQAMLSFTIPLWRGKYRAAEREARASRSARAASLEDRTNLLEAEFESALYHFRDAGRKLHLYRDSLRPLAEQSLNVIQKSWETGKADFLSLIDAERRLLEFQLQAERALANREQRRAELEMLIGASLTGRDFPDRAGPDGNPPTLDPDSTQP